MRGSGSVGEVNFIGVSSHSCKTGTEEIGLFSHPPGFLLGPIYLEDSTNYVLDETTGSLIFNYISLDAFYVHES